tara:strand:- start:122 stop:739 length:618 start_codon:yes stop_codon:yes gene_type:complete
MYTISGKSSDEFKIKGSLFKSYTFEVNNTLDVKKYISQLEKKFPDASHICYAYRICNIDNLDMFYNPEIIESFNDDGEPSSTAGKPILNVLKKSKVVNRIVFVIRYFGGTKLGINGLIESYKYAAELVILNTNYQKWILYKNIDLNFEYKFNKSIKSLISDYEGKIIKSNFTESIFLRVKIPNKNLNHFKNKIIEKTSGTISILK